MTLASAKAHASSASTGAVTVTATAVCAIAVMAALGGCAAGASADAGPSRAFPATALRGTLTVVASPQVQIDGRPARLAPGARIRDADNRMLLNGQLPAGRGYLAHYTVENGTGLVRDVWLLTPREAERTPWPATRAEAQRWTFNPAQQTWRR